jgi:hypothetical protein
MELRRGHQGAQEPEPITLRRSSDHSDAEEPEPATIRIR